MSEREVTKSSKAEMNIQDHFMGRLKQFIPAGIGLAEELAEILQVNTDSAYRRIRGEIGLTIEDTEHWVKNMERKSTVISGVGEKQRYQFFSQMFCHMDECIEKITKA